MAEIGITYNIDNGVNDDIDLGLSVGADCYVVTAIDGLDSAVKRVYSENRPARDGVIVYPTYRGPRTVVVTGVCLAQATNTPAGVKALVDALSGVIDGCENSDAILSYTPSGNGEAERYVSGRSIDGLAVSNGAGPFIKNFTFTLLCPDGQVKSVTEHTQAIARAATKVLANAGNTRVYPNLITITGPSSGTLDDCTITHVGSGRYIELNNMGLTSTSNKVIINPTLETVVDEDGLSCPGFLAAVMSDFFDLDVSNNSITFACGQAVNAHLDITWNDGYTG